VEERLPPLLPPISGKASTGKYQIQENSNDEFRIFYMKEVGLYMFRTHYVLHVHLIKNMYKHQITHIFAPITEK